MPDRAIAPQFKLESDLEESETSLILNDEQLDNIWTLDTDNYARIGKATLQDLKDTIADLQRQLREHEEAAATAMRIMIEGRPGAAQNAVREDYPRMAATLDAHDAAFGEKLLAMAGVGCVVLHDKGKCKDCDAWRFVRALRGSK